MSQAWYTRGVRRLGFGLEQTSVRPKYQTWLAEYLKEVDKESAFWFLKVVMWSFIVVVSVMGGLP